MSIAGGFVLLFTGLAIGLMVGASWAWACWADDVKAMRKLCHELRSELWEVKTKGKQGRWPTPAQALFGR